jgi:hypothetical protein
MGIAEFGTGHMQFNENLLSRYASIPIQSIEVEIKV